MRTFILTLSAALTVAAFSGEIHAQGRGRGAGAGSSPASGTGTAGGGISRRPDFATARSAGALRGVGRENTPGESGGIGRSGPPVGSQLNAPSAGNAAAAANEHGVAGRAKGQAMRESRGLSLQARARQQMVDRARERRVDATVAADTDTTGGDPTTPVTETHLRRAPWERAGISRADWLLAKRLASIDKLRDKGIEIGNDKLLEQADKLEAIARRQHQQRSGEFSEPAPGDEPVPGDTPIAPGDDTGSDPVTTPGDDAPPVELLPVVEGPVPETDPLVTGSTATVE